MRKWAVVAACLILTSIADAADIEILTAQPGTDRRGSQVIDIVVSKASVPALREISEKNVGQPSRVLLGDRVVMQPVFREPLMSDRFQVSDQTWTQDDLVSLSRVLTGQTVRVEVP